MGDILVVDDNALVLEFMRDLLELAGYRVHSTARWSGVAGLLASHEISVVLLDLGLPDPPGGDLLAGLGGPGQKRPRVILHSGLDESDLRAASQQLGMSIDSCGPGGIARCFSRRAMTISGAG